MGKPSFKSRQSKRIQKKNRIIKALNNKDEEIADLQIQMQEFKKLVFDSGKNILNEVERTSRQNNNLAKWLNIYDSQLKEREQEIYDLRVKLYFSQQQQPQNHPQHQQPKNHPQNQPHQLQLKPQPQSPAFKSLDDYFAATTTSTTTTTATSTATSTETSTATIATSAATSTSKNLID